MNNDRSNMFIHPSSFILHPFDWHFTGRFVMSIERKVAVITGASQGIGAGLVRGFLDRGYRVVDNSRSIKPDASADVLTVAGDITDPAVAERVIGDAVEE